MAKRKTDKYIPIPEKNFDLLENSLLEVVDEGKKKIDEIEVDEFNGGLQLYISNEILKTCDYFMARKGQSLEESDYIKGFTAFQELLNEINKKTAYTPTPITFAKFMGISWQTLKVHANQQNDRGEIVRKILDTFIESNFQNMYGNKINPLVGIFASKSLLGLRDNDNPNITVNVNTSPTSVESILKEYGMTELD